MKKSLLSFMVAVATTLSFSTAASADITYFNNDGVADWDSEAGAGLTQSVTVAEDEEITSISLTFYGLTHDWLGDLSFQLSSGDVFFPTVMSVLPNHLGGGSFGDSSHFDGDYTFADGGGSLWDEAIATGGGVAVAPGIYQASSDDGNGSEQVLSFNSTFGGMSTAGEWSINFLDSFPTLDTGGMTGWSITFNASAVPEPGSASVLGLAAVGLIAARRRRK